MSKIGIFCKAAHQEVECIACELGKLARASGWEVLVETALDGLVPGSEAMSDEEVAREIDLAVVLGGDGTMIRVIKLLDDRQIPVFGVNLGFLGYLTNFTVDEAKEHFRSVLLGNYETEARARLLAKLERDGEPAIEVKVINDVVINISGMSRIIEIHTEIDGIYLTKYRADGLIVSTPTGSTAYSLSAGGPIVVPWTQAVVMTPICPHTLTMRPLVLQEDSLVRLWIDSPKDSVLATFDGQQAEPLRPGDRLSISKAAGQVLLIKPPRDYFKILRTKLKWGQVGLEHD